jgi:hypothetical protein
MQNITLDYYKNLNLDQPHEVQTSKNLNLCDYEFKEAYEKAYFSGLSIRRLRRSVRRFLNKAGFFIFYITCHRFKKLSRFILKRLDCSNVRTSPPKSVKRPAGINWLANTICF